ncbi:hypothetical protein PG991_010572 [Apiospora marii]|uniref:Uncharacterized protein n=1 Tax=Apiospora marii TaxID=335849 RepID=A0ABR1RBN8_9PEZI
MLAEGRADALHRRQCVTKRRAWRSGANRLNMNDHFMGAPATWAGSNNLRYRVGKTIKATQQLV